MIKIGEYIVKPTVFPDGTTQIWGIPEDLLLKYRVEWTYHGDEEIFYLVQLGMLIRSYNVTHDNVIQIPRLYVDTLPYARQDKEVSNKTTFALHALINMLERYYIIETIDVHNPKIRNDIIINTIPNEVISEVINDCNPDLICFPDTGASKRGYDTQGLPSFSLSKNRDQTTGEILGLKCDLPLDLNRKSVILIDDLCDGGGTFIAACKLLKDMGASKVYLYTTHGLYTKGTKKLFDAGLDRIFNYKEEVLK